MVRLKNVTEFRAKILLAFAGAYLISWLIILVAIYIAFDNQKSSEHGQIREELIGRFEEVKAQRTDTLASLLDALSQRQALHGKLSLDNHDLLYDMFKRDFSQLKEKLNITHFYITDANRQHIARIHSKERFGDTEDRYIPLLNDATGTTRSGVYLGRLGSITHRVMKPLYPHGDLVGFMELGEEIDVIWEEVAHQFDASVFIMVEKNRLAKDYWLMGKGTFGWPGAWSDMQTHALTGGSNYRNMFNGQLSRLFEDSLTTGSGETLFNGKTFIYDHIPLMDSTLGNIGAVFIIYPQGVVTGEFFGNLKKASIASAIAMLLGIALCYTLLRPIAKSMENRQSELESQITLHTKDLLTAKEVAEAERNNAIIANKAKSDFLSNMSHELRTPLNSIIGFSSIVMKDKFEEGVSERYKSYVLDIHNAGTHLLAIINDILDVSRIEAGEMDLKIQNICATTVLEECQRMINVRATERLVAVIHDHYEEDLYLDADPTRLKQIILNLLTNAVKFTKAPGIIRFSARKISSEEIEFIVQDEGVGIPENEIPEVLRRFGQAATNVLKKDEEEGTGLGLTLVQDLIRLHHGSFEFRSKEGEGTRVRFTLPIHHKHSEASDMI